MEFRALPLIVLKGKHVSCENIVSGVRIIGNVGLIREIPVSIS